MTPDIRKKIKETILAAIEDYSVESLEENDFRKHLGGSEIGKSCARQLFYKFRWAKHDTPHSENYTRGQLLRLFDRGDREEPVVVKLLEGIGCEVSTIDAFTRKQYQIEDCHGHFGGSLDGKVLLPPQFSITELLLLECKTYKDADFRKLANVGVKQHKPEHWAQMCTYGVKSWLNYAIYVAVNKDNDKIHIEILELDHDHGTDCIRRAAEIIFTVPQQPPQRIAQNSAYFVCKWCNFKDICHHGELPEKNCRSCVNSRPGGNGSWVCVHHQITIDNELIKVGCNEWKPIS